MMNLGFVMSLQNQNNSRWSGGTHGPPLHTKKFKTLSAHKIMASGTDRVFCLLSSFSEVKSSMRYDTMKHLENCGVEFKQKARNAQSRHCSCFMTTHVPF
ncbi:hypothetical protein AVEN_186089-1 [Araneus ventricosus]|uniref:Uncharacterized protein n=1 Tax=Araneus ventricosus TaxID=182803 RepID=A0A4Y2P1N1_ARAVE|nr:hypothetical protein AVEN_186089-1 [Araneus ventricosus]